MPDMTDFKVKTRELIDDLKLFVLIMDWVMMAMSLKSSLKLSCMALNDKFIYEAKQIDNSLTEEKQVIMI